ncbi:MAG: translation initiation factor IF-2 [Oscillospiraceae bacterium]|nr:translation initiation factor IF-2 [Oscillospiraceae bacterium]
MIKKYKVSELAKDLGLKSKDIISSIEKYFNVTKKTGSVLTEEEVNVVLEVYTKANEVKTFDDYFASAADKPKKAEKAPKPTAKTDESTAKYKDSKTQKTDKKDIPAKSKDKFSKPKPPKKKDKLTKTITLKPKLDEPTTNVVQEDRVRHVDTRTVQVNLEKYNERYENMARTNKIKDGFQRKQKIKHRPNQKNQRSNKRETEAQKLQRLALERARKQQLKIKIPDEILVSELATRLKVNVAEVIKKLIALGVMSGINDIIDFDTASLIAEELGAKVEHEVIVTIEERLFDEEEDDKDNLEHRDPVVVVMGHVDHGKTSLLDKIRNSEVVSSEAGGITQHIGAYTVHGKDNKNITFLDTPGHEAFTSMRMRGANMTDIAILVVAADDGIMPQTIEAINHAKAAEVSIIVAINKIDKPEANPDRVMQELTEHGLIPEEWGGDVICVKVSAKTGEGLEDLLEMVNLVADVKDLKANSNRLAKGAVIEAYLDKGRGPVATLLVQNGTLKIGDSIIAGVSVGRVRAMLNDKGVNVKTAGPSTPVEITGLAEVPSAGDMFNAVENEKLARELVDKRKFAEKQEQFLAYNKVTLDNLFSQIEEGERKELAIVVKADVQGSVEAIKHSLEKLSNKEVKVSVIHGAVGAINKSDVMLANASNAIIIGFNVRPDAVAKHDAKEQNVELRLYRVIYDAIEDVEQAIKGMLEPKIREVELGMAEVREVYKISNVGTIAGCYVTEGKVARSAQIRLVRDGVVIVEDMIKSLKRFKDDVKEVAKGYECGIGLEKFNDIKVGDVFESFNLEEYKDE